MNNTYPFAGYSKIQEQILKKVIASPNARILEMGIGTGRMTSKLYDSGYEMSDDDQADLKARLLIYPSLSVALSSTAIKGFLTGSTIGLYVAIIVAMDYELQNIFIADLQYIDDILNIDVENDDLGILDKVIEIHHMSNTSPGSPGFDYDIMLRDASDYLALISKTKYDSSTMLGKYDYLPATRENAYSYVLDVLPGGIMDEIFELFE